MLYAFLIHFTHVTWDYLPQGMYLEFAVTVKFLFFSLFFFLLLFLIQVSLNEIRGVLPGFPW